MLCGCNVDIIFKTKLLMRQFDIQFVNSIGLTKAGMGRCAIRARPWSAKYHTVSSYGAGISQDQY